MSTTQNSSLQTDDGSSAIATVVEQCFSMGYLAAPVKGKRWWSVTDIVHQRIVDEGLPFVRSLYSTRPGAGVGVVCGPTQNPKYNVIAIDVDSDDQELIAKTALVVGTPAPTKRGLKGVTIIVRTSSATPNVLGILKPRELDKHYSFVEADSIKTPWAKGYQKPGSDKPLPAAIDLLGISGKRHTVLPPSIHPDTNAPYEWVPFPGTDMLTDLNSTPLTKLPLLEERHVMLLVNLADNPESKLWQFIGQTSEGDYHDKMRDAVFYMYHQMFTDEEIEAICMEESALTTDDPRKTDERREEVRKAIYGMRNKERNPARQRGKDTNKKDRAGKVPDDRLIMSWLNKRFEDQDTLLFNATPYHWNNIDNRWNSVADHTHPNNPLVHVTRELHRLFPSVGINSIRTGMAAWESSILSKTPSPDHRLIPFTDGLLDATTGEFRKETKEDYIPVRLNIPYDPSAKAPKWRNFLHHLFEPPSDVEAESQPDVFDEDHQRAIAMVEEFLGYCLVRSHRFQKMLFIVGKTGVGKTTFMNVVKGIMPEGQVSDVEMEEFDNPNSVRRMVNCNINISSEIGRHGKSVDSFMLRASCGEPVGVKTLYKDNSSAVIAARMIFHGNMMPDTTDSTGAIARRMLLLKTTDRIGPMRKNEYWSEILEEAPGIINSLVTAYRNLLARGDFLLPEYSKISAAAATDMATSVSFWFKERTEPVDNYKDGDPSEELFMDYVSWCESNQYRPMNRGNWERELSKPGQASGNARVVGPDGKVSIVKRRKFRIAKHFNKIPY